ncbi:plastid division protein CDP1 chloroplastic [Prunus yedoensis var. nudiflora]|uniref:Plastid division protein CDP1 chloroplastic n=1 Tax=Prunus yedoensis var. nudiflora TaxID=2094558 RepID=A0A314ZB07_PRUYE|nr:plastid division protein CDP1 chloroplastic [Prunus yedoensis var. nudiflora]
MNSSQHLGAAVKQLAPTNLQSPLILGKTSSGSSASASSVQLKRNLGMHHDKVWNGWVARGVLVARITFVAVLGCIVFASLRLTGMKGNKMRSASKRLFSTYIIWHVLRRQADGSWRFCEGEVQTSS